MRVTFTPTEIQRDLRELVMSVVTDQVSGDTVRRVMLDTGVDDTVWETLVSSGVHALLIPEAYGGAGASFADAMVVSDVLARAVTPVPYLSSAIVAPTFLTALGASNARDGLLTRLSAGSRAAVVSRDPAGHPDKPATVTVERRDGTVVLNGSSGHVCDGAGAQDLIVVATHAGHQVAVVVPRDTPGVTITPVSVLDLTRPLAHVTLTDVSVADSAVLHGDVAGACQLAKRAALVALSHEAVGGLDALLSMTTRYARDRVQFGRAIGSFQAVKHRLVDVLIAKEAATSAALYAANVWGDGDEAQIASFTAAAFCLPAYANAAATCLQLFGGIGFTWEHDVHLHVKRAKASSLLFGSAKQHRRELASVLAL